jgi:mono/diheme cytochrome c family protein
MTLTPLLSAIGLALVRAVALGSLLAAAVGDAPGAIPSLRLEADRQSPFDLEIAGELAGVATGERRYVRWSALRSLPTRTLDLTGEFVPRVQEVTVVFLDDLWRRLPVTEKADTLVASCTDGYVSVFPREAIWRYRPFIVLEIDGEGPEAWPPAGLSFNPGPYVISVSATVAPSVATLLDSNHKRPWGVSRIEIVNYARYFEPAFAGEWAQLSSRAREGRELWIHSCASCHAGPNGLAGGTKSDRPFAVLAAYAKHSPDHFKRYVRDPRSVSPGAKMEPHPRYTDAQLDALIAFVTAER